MDAQDVKSASSIQVKANVAAVNDAPTVLSGKESVALTAIPEDASSITGATVSSLFGDSFSDAKDQVSGGSSANTLSGIAITGNAATAAQGKWQWSANGSTNWTDIPNDTAGSDAPTNTHVYYLRADASLRFAPATDFNGTPGALTTHLVESSWPSIGGATNGLRVDNPDAQYYTATAVTLSTSVTSVNDAPTGTDDSITIDEDGIKEFTSDDFGFADAKDSPANTLSAVIITSKPENGSLLLNNDPVNVGDSIPVASLGNEASRSAIAEADQIVQSRSARFATADALLNGLKEANRK